MFSTAAAYLGVYYCKWRVLICKTYWLFSDLMNSRSINYNLHHSEQDTKLQNMKISSSKCPNKRINLARPCVNQRTYFELMSLLEHFIFCNSSSRSLCMSKRKFWHCFLPFHSLRSKIAFKKCLCCTVVSKSVQRLI